MTARATLVFVTSVAGKACCRSDRTGYVSALKSRSSQFDV